MHAGRRRGVFVGFPVFGVGDMAFLKYSVLVFRVLLWTLLASLVVFVLASGSGVMHERTRALEAAHRDAVEAVEHNLPTVAISLWQYDISGLRAIARGLVQTESLARVEIGDHRGVVAEARQSGAADAHGPTWTKPVLAPETGKEIGYVRVYESYAPIETKLRESVGLLLLVELVKIGGLAIILFVIVYRKVARHLHDLAEDVSRLDPGDETPQVELRRKKFGSYRDEFDILVDAINRFLLERAEETGRRTLAERNLQQRVSEVETMLGTLSDGVIALDDSRRVRYANRAASLLLRLGDQSPVGAEIGQLLVVEDEKGTGGLNDPFGEVLARREAMHFRGNVSIRPAGAAAFEARLSIVPVPDSGEVAVLVVFTDISAEIAKERKIEFQAFHDPLTRLGNRSMLARDLPRDLATAAGAGQRVAVLCLDLDNFKNINDALGHMIGDILLRQLADRFRTAVQVPGWVTRHGGDEFIVVLPQLISAEPAVALAQRLMTDIAQPFLIEGHQLRVTSSIGISLSPDHGLAIGHLLSCADLAMYAAKHEGKNTYRFFEESLLKRSAERLSMENGLRVAILEQQFSLVYQPKLNLSTGVVDAVEALIRWQQPGVGPVSPMSFIPVAEETGLINEIGTWVLQQSCAAARRMRLALGRDLAVAVNVSPLQFRGETLMATLAELAQDNPDLRGLIEIELTESALSGDIAEVVAKLEAMRRLGLRIAIDDFGTGYSSLAYLKNLPVDILKIDQAFVRGLPNSKQDQAVVRAVVQLGHSFGFSIVAEGVEEKIHADRVSSLGCEYAQGYWFARPMPENELIAFLSASPAV